MEIYAARLTRQGKHLVVDVQTRNGWIEAIRESDDGTTPISHICEQSGLVQANRNACEQSSFEEIAAKFRSDVLPHADFSTWSRENLEKVASEMLQALELVKKWMLGGQPGPHSDSIVLDVIESAIKKAKGE